MGFEIGFTDKEIASSCCIEHGHVKKGGKPRNTTLNSYLCTGLFQQHTRKLNMPTLHKRTSPHGYDETDYYIIKQMPNQIQRTFTAYQVSDAAEQRLRQAGRLYDGAQISSNFFNILRNVFRLIYTKNELNKFMTATKEGNTNKVINLIGTKIGDVNIKVDDGRTALSWAAERGHMAIVQFLIARQGDVNVKDKYGRTPLSWAAERGHIAIVQFLLLNGANRSVEDAYGHNARWWAEFNCQTAIARLL